VKFITFCEAGRVILLRTTVLSEAVSMFYTGWINSCYFSVFLFIYFRVFLLVVVLPMLIVTLVRIMVGSCSS